MGLGTENETTEFVDDMSQLDYGLKAMVAMLNRYNRAEVLIGVDGDGNPTGADLTEEDVRKAREGMLEKVHRQPLAEISLETYGDGRRYIRMSVRGYEIPYSFDGWFYARTYRCERSGTGVVTRWNATLTCAMKRHRSRSTVVDN